MKMLTSLSGGVPVIDATLPAGRTLEEMQAATESTANRLLSRLRQAKREPMQAPDA
jgi:hypothetical protein